MDKPKMIKVEKQLYKKLSEQVTLIDASGNRTRGEQVRKEKAGTQVIELVEEFFKKYLSKNPDYWVAGAKKSEPAKEEPKKGEA